jgi:hypothetical protein
MLVFNYKPTCSYSFTVSLSLRNVRPMRRTLRYQCQFDHRKLDLCSTMAKCHALSLVTSLLRPRILPRHGLALVDSSIQSP